jgi:hypothetical protein
VLLWQQFGLGGGELVLVGDYDGGVVLFEVAERFGVEVFVVVGLGLRLVV